MKIAPKTRERLAAWWRDPEQELLRGEVAWALRWLRHGAGRYWLAAYVIVYLANALLPPWIYLRPFQLLDSLGMSANRSWMNYLIRILTQPIFYFYPGRLVPNLALIVVVQQRVFARLKPERLSQSLVAGFSAKRFWPALFAAPLVVAGALALLNGALDAFYFQYRVVQSPPMDINNFRPFSFLLGLLPQLCYIPTTVLWHWLGFAAVLMLEIWFAVPRGGYLRVGLCLLAAYFLSGLLLDLIVSLGLARILDVLFEANSSLALPGRILMEILNLAIQFAWTFLIYRLVMARLRGPAGEEKLRRWAVGEIR